jgi:LPS sulfotransferase NodH
VPYSRQIIDDVLNHIANCHRDFDLFFGMNGIVPARVDYEDLVEQPHLYMSVLARKLDLTDLRVNPGKVAIARQADAINLEWRRRYLAGL